MSESKAMVAFGNRGLQLTSIETAWRFAEMVARSGLAPRSFVRAEQIMVALQYGAELGITPMQSLQNLTVINGKVGMLGDLARALVESSEQCEWIRDNCNQLAKMSLDDDSTACVIKARRRGSTSTVVRQFSVEDAKRANLWKREGPWSQYPRRMLYYRALGFLLRDAFPDVLRGIVVAEELQDYPPQRMQSGATIGATDLDQLVEASDGDAEETPKDCQDILKVDVEPEWPREV